MSKSNNGDKQVFPGSQAVEYGVERGLTKREWFAGMMAMGILSRERDAELYSTETAKGAIRMADELLAQLSRSEETASFTPYS